MTSPRDPRCMSPRQFLRYVEEIEGTWGLHKGKRRISDRGFDLFWEHQKELLLSMFPNQDEKSAYEECKRLFQQESISQCTGILTYARRRARRLIGQEWEKIRTMPIGWISKRTLNAGAIAVPAGGNIIVLDSSFWVDLPFIWGGPHWSDTNLPKLSYR